MIGHCYVTVMVRPRDSGEAFRPHQVLIQEGCGMARAELEHRAAYRLILQGYEPSKVVRIQKVTAAQLERKTLTAAVREARAAMREAPLGVTRDHAVRVFYVADQALRDYDNSKRK